MAVVRRHRGVVITGASSGIGLATAVAFAQQGAKLVLAARGTEALEQAAARCRGIGADVLCVPTDVTDAQAVRTLAVRASRFAGAIDVWVSNVGVGAVGRFEETPIEAHEQVIRANLLGHMNEAHAVVPIFLAQGHGTFVNIISLGGYAAAPFAAAYSASKFGLRGFSEALRAELAPHPRIQVCDVYPAFIDTPGISHSANYTGRTLAVPPPVYDARRVARAVVRLADQPRPSVTVGSSAYLTRLAHLLAPEMLGRVTAFGMRAYFNYAGRRPRTDGNLFRPSAGPPRIDGGHRRWSSEAKALAVGGAILAGVLAVRRLRAMVASATAPRPGRQVP